MNAVSSIILAFLLFLVCCATRRWALLAIMAGVFFLTQGHAVDVAGINLYPLRFLTVAAFSRVVLRRELQWSRLNRIDWTLLAVYNCTALIGVVRSGDGIARQLAFGLDPTLCYLALRAFMKTLDDVRWLLNAIAVLLVPFTLLVCLERLTGHSSFTLVGSAQALWVREGVPRCMGSFRHAILLGSVAASMLPLYFGLWLARARHLASLGAVLCLVLVALSNSGGPATSAATAVLGWSLWPLRDRLRLVRRGVVAIVLLLLCFMKAPIWYVPSKISGIVGGSGYHRGLLMDQAWQNLDKWWLAGMNIEDTAGWIPYVHTITGGADVTNEFLLVGLRAGLVPFVLLLLLLVYGFKAIGEARSSIHRAGRTRTPEAFLVWGLGVTLLVHIVTWFGVSYFDQSRVVWLMHLAAVSLSTASVTHAGPRTSSSYPVIDTVSGSPEPCWPTPAR